MRSTYLRSIFSHTDASLIADAEVVQCCSVFSALRTGLEKLDAQLSVARLQRIDGHLIIDRFHCFFVQLGETLDRLHADLVRLQQRIDTKLSLRWRRSLLCAVFDHSRLG